MINRIAIISNKGGVGKTTTSVALATGLARRGYKTLAIDLDPQGSLSAHLGVAGPADDEFSISEVLYDNVEINKIEKATYQELLTIIQSKKDLAMFDYLMGKMQKQNWVEILRDKLLNVSDFYDYIIIDTPTGFSGLTFSALTACNNYILPCYPGALDRKGLSELCKGIEEIRKEREIGRCIGILLTKLERGKTIKNEIEEIEKEIGNPKGLFKTRISKRIKVVEAAKAGVDIHTYDKKVLAAIQYEHFTDETINRLEQI